MRKLIFIAILCIVSTSYGQMTKEDVTTITNDAWEKSVTTVYVYFDKEDYVSYRVHNCSIQDCSLNEFKAIEKIITDNYIKIIGPSDSIYLPYDKIKGMEYNRESGLFTIWM